MRAALAACALAACAADPPPLTCGDAPGLHVVVALDHCAGVSPDPTDGFVEVVAGRVHLSPVDAIEQRYADRIEYVWRWPADAIDGAHSPLAWRALGPSTFGTADGAFDVDTHACVTTRLDAWCGQNQGNGF